MEFIKCPSCGDEVSTQYRPVSCYKCGPFKVDLPPEVVAAQETTQPPLAVNLIPVGLTILVYWFFVGNPLRGVATTGNGAAILGMLIGRACVWLPSTVFGYLAYRRGARMWGWVFFGTFFLLPVAAMIVAMLIHAM